MCFAHSPPGPNPFIDFFEILFVPHSRPRRIKKISSLDSTCDFLPSHAIINRIPEFFFFKSHLHRYCPKAQLKHIHDLSFCTLVKTLVIHLSAKFWLPTTFISLMTSKKRQKALLLCNSGPMHSMDSGKKPACSE